LRVLGLRLRARGDLEEQAGRQGQDL